MIAALAWFISVWSNHPLYNAGSRAPVSLTGVAEAAAGAAGGEAGGEGVLLPQRPKKASTVTNEATMDSRRRKRRGAMLFLGRLLLFIV